MVNDRNGFEYETADSWEAARNYASLLGEVPNSFSTLIRSLMQDADAIERGAAQELRDASRFQMTRLLKGPSMKAVLLYAAMSFYPERVPPGTDLNDREMMRIFPPLELAAVFATTYLYRTARKKSKAEEWALIAQQLHPYVEVGQLVGASMKTIGSHRGILGGALPFVAHSAFLKHDPKGFTEYRRMLKKNKSRFDPEFEIKRWGCTVIQVASILMQAVGFGITLAGDFTRGLGQSQPIANLDKDAYRFKIADIWMNSLLAVGKPPEIAHKGEFYPLAHDLSRLIERVGEMRQSGCKYLWLEKGKEDLAAPGSPSHAPPPTTGDVNPDE